MDTIGNKKSQLQSAIAKTVKEQRTIQKKSISLISNEIGITKSIWADLEKGIKDPQLSTFFRIVEGLEISPNKLLKMLEKNLGKDFSFLE